MEPGLHPAINSLPDGKIIVIISLLVTLFYLCLIRIDAVPEIMEARNLVTARECIQDGHWLVPTMNGVPRVRKPPLPTWISALSMSVARDPNSILAARLPSVLMVSLLTVFSYLVSREWLDKFAGMSAALAVATSVIVMETGRRATWDIYTLSFAIGGLWMLLRGFRTVRSRSLWIIGSSILWGLSFLSKGPVTLYTVLLPAMLSLFLSRQRSDISWKALSFVLLLSITIGMSWWGYMQIVYPETFSVVNSEVDAWGARHVRSFFFYIDFPFLIFPWTICLTGALSLLFQPINDKGREEILFFLKWLLLTLLLLSLVPEKKDRYAMPAVLPAAMMIAAYWRVLEEEGGLRLWRGTYRLHLLHIYILLILLFAASAAMIYFAWLGSSLWLLIFILPFLVIAHKIWKYRHSAAASVIYSISTVFLIVIAYTLATSKSHVFDNSFDLEGAARVADITSREKLFIFKRNEKVTWGIRRTHEVLDVSAIKDVPGMILVEDIHLGAFKDWLKSRKLISEEIYRFKYGNKGQWCVLYNINPN